MAAKIIAIVSMCNMLFSTGPIEDFNHNPTYPLIALTITKILTLCSMPCGKGLIEDFFQHPPPLCWQ